MKQIIAALLLTCIITFIDIYEPDKSQFLHPGGVQAQEPDPRIEKIQTYLEKHNSPISHLAKFIVDVSYLYGIDPYFLVAIAGTESTFCKFTPDLSYNCFGWGIHSGKVLRFNSYAEGIETVARGLNTERYREKSIEEIAQIYCAKPEKWASSVRWFIYEIKSK